MKIFDTYAEYYDLLYQDKDYAGEAAFAHRLIQRHSPGARHVLELGMGTGRHAAELAQLGYELQGIELSDAMCAAARVRFDKLAPEISARLQVESGDMSTYQSPEKKDVVQALFHVLSYQTTNAGLLQTLKNARRALNPGGIFLFDFWYGPAVHELRPSIKVKRFRQGDKEIVRVAEPDWNPRACQVGVNYQVLVRDLASGLCEETRELHEMRYFFEPELENMLAQSGFAAEAWGEWLTDKTPSPSTWGVYCVARAL